MPDSDIQDALALMMDFAERTGVTSHRPPRRYLWTDAFAVCNFLGLARATGEERYKDLALRLVDQVHYTLGRHREDDPRTGWISGLSELEGEAHPTRGGLRIGKQLAERAASERLDERLEWDRDGQYFHYLTKWMHALDQVTRWTGRDRYNRWARELAETAYHAFTYQPSSNGPRRMYWKMSIDLTRPLVASMGQHDALDGYITDRQLRSTAARLSTSGGGPNLDPEIGTLATMVQAGDWATADPLGLGGLLADVYRLVQLGQQGDAADVKLLDTLLTESLAGLQRYAAGGELRLPAEYRLAFRELGLAIGLDAAERMWQADNGDKTGASATSGVKARLQALRQYAPLRENIVSFWRDPEHQRASTWSEHRDINEVMLATSLAPDGFLVLPPPP